MPYVAERGEYSPDFQCWMTKQDSLFYFVFWQLNRDQETDWFINGFNIFMIIHLGLHLLLLKHKDNEF
ncbi:MAG: hypothetical protein AAGB24_10720 [Bacteroidota bacterium]